MQEDLERKGREMVGGRCCKAGFRLQQLQQLTIEKLGVLSYMVDYSDLSAM